MGIWLLMLTCNLSIPLIMLVFGVLFQKDAPKKINHSYGYRTTMSMKNQDTWQFAHACCAKVWRRVGAVLLVLSLAVGMLSMRLGTDGVGLVGVLWIIVQTVVLILSIYPVEKALKRTFDRDGNRR